MKVVEQAADLLGVHVVPDEQKRVQEETADLVVSRASKTP